MPAQVLILHHDAQQYLARLQPSFPDVTFHGFEHGADAKAVASGLEVIVGLGHHIPNDLIKASPKLKWVQALTTGTETLTAPRRAAAARAAHIDARHSRAADERARIPQHDRAEPEFPQDAAQPGRGEVGAMEPADPARQDDRSSSGSASSPSISPNAASCSA